ncbi:ATP-binding protein [Streptomyces sp. CRN 30]|uniref:ATP-binding protein n=1 Tax=Streptomyces sp. CRN 30 TaxID=3075613 RepID=UPI002A8342C0|nr:ATP-binding protein [Streptomyces sp. CRN 30]
MSLPLTHRIARAALLTAAGAASVVGAAGSASAAPELPAAPNVGGLTALDGSHVTDTAGSVAQEVTGLAKKPGAVKKAVPTVRRTVGQAGAKAVRASAPVTEGTAAQGATGHATGPAGNLLGGATETVGKGLPTESLNTNGLPTQGLPLNGLPALG